MGIRTGEEYIKGLQAKRPDIWMEGRRITDIVNEPVFKQPIKEIAKLYDMQHDPEYQNKITSICEETGERISNAFVVPKTYHDLMARRALYETWANATFGLMGRTPDFLNVTVTAMASTPEFYAKYNQDWADNIQNYYRYIRDNDLFLTHAIMNPQTDRTKSSKEQKDMYTHLGAVRETEEGIIVRGAKMLATLAPITDEVIIYSFPGFRPGEEDYAISFAVPIDAPGLRLICRQPVQDGKRSIYDHPLASRFEEQDAVIVFDDVLVPWDRVFIYKNIEAANRIYSETGLNQNMHQATVRGLIKLQFAQEVASSIADSIGVDGFLNVQSQLGELVQSVETIRSLLRTAENEYEVRPNGEVIPNPIPLETIRGILPKSYPKAIEIIQTISAGGLLVPPTQADIKALPDDIERYYGGREGISGEDRLHLFKLAWDLTIEGFGQRLVQYERYYSGDPIRKLGMFYSAHKRQNPTYPLVERALAESKASVSEKKVVPK